MRPSLRNRSNATPNPSPSPNPTPNPNPSSSSLVEGIEKDVRPWLQLAEELRALHLDKELAVPQIAVMGDQSSGKSSVLEALSGVPFPRGSGLVTRCPIRLVMKKSTSQWSATAYTSVSPQPRPIASASDVGAVISSLTDALASGGGFSTQSVIVEMTSPDCPDLTVIDLPGIIRTVTTGQSAAVIQQVNSLIEEYLAFPHTIILAVIPANVDIATVDILERAHRYDPSGERTLGVLTKPDLVGEGNEEEVLSVLNNVRKPLTLGYVMLKNRSQAELNSGVTTNDARQREERYFSSHSSYKKCSRSLLGVTALTNKLTNLLVLKIQLQLGPMRREVERLLSEVRTQLNALPKTETAKTPADRQKQLVSVVQEYVRHLTDCVRGEYRERVCVRDAQVRLYTHALTVFEALRTRIHTSAPRFKDEAYLKQLAHTVEQLRGRELPGFMSSQAFHMCMSGYVEDWRAHCQWCVNELTSLTVTVANRMASLVLAPYPQLVQTLEGIIGNVCAQSHDECVKLVDEIKTREKDPFTLNDFLAQWINKLRFARFESAVDRAFGNRTNTGATMTQEAWNALKDDIHTQMRQWYRNAHGVTSSGHVEDLVCVLEAYWGLSVARTIDCVCMAADRAILQGLPAKVQEELYRYVNDDDMLTRFFTESEAVTQLRGDLTKRRERLISAHSALGNIHIQTVSQVQTQEGEMLKVSVTVVVGPNGLGLQLADDNNRVRVKGYRLSHTTDGTPGVSAGQQAGIMLEDILYQIDGATPSSFAEFIQKLKESRGTIALTVLREQAS